MRKRLKQALYSSNLELIDSHAMKHLISLTGFSGVAFFIFLVACSGSGNKSDAVAQDTIPSISKADSNLMLAQKALEQDSSEENFIWYGRRLGYVNRMQEAIDVFTAGIIKYPNSWKLYRFRGHRFISTREFALAIIDLEKAKKMMQQAPIEIEPDGLPNKINTPLSTFQYNVYYHLGLGYYLIGEFYRAEIAFKECMKLSDNDDLRVATSDWLYMIYRRMNDQSAARNILTTIHDNMNIVENDAYYKRLKMYQGKISPDSLLSVIGPGDETALNLATQGYGVGNWYYYTGDPDKAWKIFKQITSGTSTHSFGFIAAETDLARLWRKP